MTFERNKSLSFICGTNAAGRLSLLQASQVHGNLSVIWYPLGLAALLRLQYPKALHAKEHERAHQPCALTKTPFTSKVKIGILTKGC